MLPELDDIFFLLFRGIIFEYVLRSCLPLFVQNIFITFIQVYDLFDCLCKVDYISVSNGVRKLRLEKFHAPHTVISDNDAATGHCFSGRQRKPLWISETQKNKRFS